MNRLGPGPQPQGNMFTQNENRLPAGSRRLQNGKIDQFSFAMGNGGNAPGIPNAQSRTPSFAQTIGGQQTSRPLDLSEFPSLGGNAQAQQQNPSFAPGVSPWRTRSPGPERRAYAGGIGRGRGQIQDESGPGFTPGTEGYRFGGQAGANQLSGLAQQTGPSMQQSRLGLTSPAGDQGERTTSSAIGDDRHGSDRGVNARSGRTVANPFPSQQDQGPVGYQGRATGSQDQASTDTPSSPQQMDPSSRPKQLADMNEQEKWSLAGLLVQLDQDHPDYNPLSRGMDLTSMGLDLQITEPLHTTFHPFDDRPVIPSFTLPPAYTVSNVPPLESKMDSFSDETLIWIFYQYPRDFRQELAAQTLYKRDWRWHKELRQWMMKDATFGGVPTRISESRERGYYVFFDVGNWRRERREFVLDYEHLEARPNGVQVGAGGGGMVGGPGNGGSGAGASGGMVGGGVGAGSALLGSNGNGNGGAPGLGVSGQPNAQLLGSAFPGGIGGIGGGAGLGGGL